MVEPRTVGLRNTDRSADSPGHALRRRRRGVRPVHGPVLHAARAEFADLAGGAAGQRVLDVGCGPGALTTELVRRVGAAAVVGRRSVGAVRRGSRSATPGSTCGAAPPSSCRSGRHLRCGPRPARRPLHDRPCRRAGRDARVTRAGGRWPHASGITAAAGAAEPVLGGRARARPRRHPTSRTWPAPGRVSSSELFEAAGLRRRSRRQPLGEGRAPELRGVVAAVHARRRSGRRLRSGTRRRAASRSCASSARRCCRRPRSC